MSKDKKPKIIAVDFDGTLCENKWPEIGGPNFHLIWFLMEQQQKYGAKLILWTCRVGDRLAEAVQWCKDHGLEFDAVNTNLPEVLEWMGTDSRKIYADVYIDDRNDTELPFVPYNPKYKVGIDLAQGKDMTANWTDAMMNTFLGRH